MGGEEFHGDRSGEKLTGGRLANEGLGGEDSIGDWSGEKLAGSRSVVDGTGVELKVVVSAGSRSTLPG